MLLIFEKIRKLPDWFFITILSFIIVISVSLSYKFYSSQFVCLFNDAIQPLEKAYEKNMNILQNETYNNNLDVIQREILVKKTEVIQHKKSHHLFLTLNLYKNNYSLLSLFPFLSAITGIFVFIIIQSGWRESNIFLKFGLIIFATLTALTSIFPDIYQQKLSIDNNLKNYIEYDNLQHEVFSYSLTAPDDPLKFNLFLDSLNFKENKLNKIYFVLSEQEFKNPLLEKFGAGN